MVHKISEFTVGAVPSAMSWHTSILVLLLATQCAASEPQDPANAQAPKDTEKVSDDRLIFDWASEKAPHQKEMIALMDRGAKPDGYRDPRGKTALMMVSSIAHTAVMQTLIDYGADVNAKTKNGGCPMLAACSSVAVDAVKLLKKHGADIKATTKGGMNCLVVALTASNKVSTRAKAQFIEYVLKHGGDAKAKSRHGDSLLSGMAFKSETELVRALLKHAKPEELDIDSKNTIGKTALMYGAERGNVEIVRLLLEAGANPTIDTAPQGAKQGEGKTALDLAKEGYSPKHKEIVKLLDAHVLPEGERPEL